VITVIGSNGFVGRHLVEQLESQNIQFNTPNKGKLPGGNLGTVVICAGHGDCKNFPLKVFDSNAQLIVDLIKNSSFTKIIYLSSTRLYKGISGSNEKSDLLIETADDRRLFNLTKAVAEEVIIRSNINYSILRPSNIYGGAFESPLFLPSIVRDALIKGRVSMYVDPDYAKDYVSVLDLVEVIIKCCVSNDTDNQVINVASGENITAQQIADKLQSETGCKIDWLENNNNDYFPVTENELMKKIINSKPRNVLDDLGQMVDEFKIKLNKNL
jgi:nucleoside-diphosphate-sugar epimerase